MRTAGSGRWRRTAELAQATSARLVGQLVARPVTVSGFSILIHPEMVPYGQEVVVLAPDGSERYRGTPEPDWVTLIESFDARLDRRMVFDRRVDL